MHAQARSLSLTSIKASVQFWPVELVFYERYNEPGTFAIKVLCNDLALDPKAWIGQRLTLTIAPKDQAARVLSAHVQKISAEHTLNHGYRFYTLHMTSWLGLLAQTENCSSFVNANVPDIIDRAWAVSKLTDINSSQLNAEYLPREYTVQYNESQLDFGTRLLARAGIFYWVDYHATGQTIMLGDSVRAYTRNLPTLSWPGGFIQNHPNAILDAKIQAKKVPSEMISAYRNYEDAQTVQEKATRVMAKNDMHGLSLYDYQGTSQALHADALLAQAQESHLSVQLMTRHVAMRLGQLLKLEGELPIALREDSTCVPYEIVHSAKDYGGLPQSIQVPIISLLPREWQALPEACYRNHVNARPWKKHPFYPTAPCERKKSPGQSVGFVVGRAGKVQDVDSQGRVRVWFPWDQNNSNADPLLCPFVRVAQRQAGDAFGHQFLPHVGDEVTVSFSDEQSQAPHIIASSYNARTKPPFKLEKDKTLSGMKTYAGHALYFSDMPGSEQVVLHSAHDFKKEVGHDEARTIAHNDSIAVYGDEVHNILKGNYCVEANKKITLAVGGSAIEIGEASIKITGAKVLLQGAGGEPVTALSVKGDQHSCPKVTGTTPHIGGVITTGSPNVFIGGKAAARVGDKASCHSGTDTLVKGHGSILINGRPAVGVKHKTDHGGKVTQGVPRVSAGGNPALTPKNATVLSDAEPLVFDFTMVDHLNTQWLRARSHYFTVQNTGGETFKYHLDTHTLQAKTFNLKPGVYQCAMEPHVRTLDIIGVNAKPQIPYYKAAVDVNGPGAVHCDLLWPMMVVDLRDDATPDDAMMLNDHDIDYLKKNGNNVLVFVHGYNIPLGALSKEFASVKTRADDIERGADEEAMMSHGGSLMAELEIEGHDPLDDITGFVNSDRNSTIFRDLAIVQEQLLCEQTLPDSLFESLDAKEAALNGTGAFNWFVHMEKNFNEATGQFKAGDASTYKKYTRCVHVTWSGNPKESIDYMDAVPRGLNAGVKLATLILFLKKQGLLVNVVAHSLGNAVLFSAMDAIGKKLPGAIDHAFMWEAAIPNNAFTRPKPAPGKTDAWYLPKALAGAKKVTVLHSKNDNILGAIPAVEPAGVSRADIYRAKPFWDELVPALILTDMGFHSMYHLATWFGVPTTHLLLPDVQQQVYTQWRDTLPDGLLISATASDAEKKEAVLHGKYLPMLRDQMSFEQKIDDKNVQLLYKKAQDMESRINKALAQAGWGIDAHGWLSNKHEVELGEWAFNHIQGLFDTIGIALDTVAPVGAVRLTLDIATMKPALGGMACLVKMMRVLPNPPPPALGYSGLVDQLPGFYNVDETPYLYSHSAMKIPSKALMRSVYQNAIINAGSGVKRFGEYF
jgi:type VI secretion system VgrG family protein